jgi:hypothetical protein
MALRTCIFIQIKTDLLSCLHHLFGYVIFCILKAPEWFQFAGRYLFIAICHLTWLSSRKYGTVWYHPASSKLWNLTTLSFVNFQGKLTGTSRDLFACEASLFGLLCAWREVQILRQHSRLSRAGSASLEGSRFPRAGSASLEAPSRARPLPHAGTGI